jgi:hypothetical protein
MPSFGRDGLDQSTCIKPGAMRIAGNAVPPARGCKTEGWSVACRLPLPVLIVTAMSGAAQAQDSSGADLAKQLSNDTDQPQRGLEPDFAHDPAGDFAG